MKDHPPEHDDEADLKTELALMLRPGKGDPLGETGGPG